MSNPILDQILPGDSMEVLGQLPAASVDLVFADPPYNLQLARELWRPDQTHVNAVDDGWDKFDGFDHYDQFTSDWLSACRRVLKGNGTLWVIGSYHNIFRIGKLIQDLNYWILNDVIWIKNNPMPNFHGVRFTNAHETLIWAQKIKGAKYTFNYQSMKALNDDLQMRSDWYLPLCTGSERIKRNGEKAHATQKPESLLYRILLASTNPGDVVLDPFFGTGTTGAVARKLKRHFIGIERDPDYIKLASKRISLVKPSPDVSLSQAGSRNRPRIPFGALLESGLLQPGQKLIFARDSSVSATILANGHLSCKGLTGSIHSVAKSLLGGAPANGWDMWFCEKNGHRKTIDTLRQQIYIQRIPDENETTKVD
jgi:DNA modification methylase